MAYELDRTTRAPVAFKLGTQAAMDLMLAKNTQASEANRAGTHGTFYLTQDTHRLYVGNSDKTISPVNEGILTVTSLPSSTSTPAPMPGQFYYLSNDNILCIYAGSNQWIQVNAVTSEVTSVAMTVSTTSGTASIETRVNSTGGNHAEDTYTMQGASGVTVSSSGKAITITGNVPALAGSNMTGNAGVELKLDNSNGTDSTINLKNGDNVTIAMDSGAIKIDAVDSTISQVTTGTRTAANGGGFSVDVKDTSGAHATGYITPQIKYGSGTTSTVNFESGVATLDVYTKGQTDTAITNAIREVNAMTYKGTVASASALPTTASGVRIGDTYILTDGDTINNVYYPAGSMIIAAASNTESASTGLITTNPIVWDAVNSAGQDTTYSASSATYGFSIAPSTGGLMMQYQLAAGTAISLSEAGTINATGGKTVTVAHATVNSNLSNLKTTQSEWVEGYTSTSVDEVMTGITVNAQGHVTGYTVKKLTFHSEIGTLSGIGYSDTTNNGSGHTHTNTSIATANGITTSTIKLGYMYADGGGNKTKASNEFGIASESLEVTASGMSTSLNLIWGSFTAS